MSIRIKLILTYAILVFISALVLIFSGIAMVSNVFIEVTSSVFEETNAHLLLIDVVDLLSELKQAEDYEPEKLIKGDFIKELNDKADFYNGGILVKYEDEVYNFSELPSNENFYSHFVKVSQNYELGHMDGHGDKYLVEYDNKYYFYIDYSFEVKDKEATYFFVVNINKTGEIRDKFASKFFKLIFVMLILITIPLIIIITKDIIMPIRELEKGVKHIKDGNLDFKLRTKSKNEIGRVIKYFDLMRSELKKSINKQMQFEENRKELISSISHDLKTPVTSIKGHIEGIRDGVASTPEKLEKYLNVIYQKTTDIDQLIDDLFLFSKLDLNKLPFDITKVSVTLFLESLINEMKLGWESEKNFINLKINTDDLYFAIDQQQIKRVFVNIIQNSMKYIEKEIKKIDIVVNNNNEYIQIIITDNGSGIDEDNLSRIFDRFYRVDESRSSETGGTGLGLAIAKEIVNQHGGHIFATSIVGEGTKIIVELKKEI